MWIKDEKVFSGIIILDGMKIHNPTEAQLRAAGYERVEPPAPEPPPARYSKLKIIRALGDAWAAYRAQIEAAGFLDQFMAAEYLAEDDPAFAAFLADVPDEIKSKLDNCLWEA